MIRVPMHLVHRPDTRADLVADKVGGPLRFEGVALPLPTRAQVLAHLGQQVVLEGPGAPELALDGGTEVSLSTTTEAGLCAALLGLGGAAGVVVLWGEVQGLPVVAAA